MVPENDRQTGIRIWQRKVLFEIFPLKLCLLRGRWNVMSTLPLPIISMGTWTASILPLYWGYWSFSENPTPSARRLANLISKIELSKLKVELAEFISQQLTTVQFPWATTVFPIILILINSSRAIFEHAYVVIPCIIDKFPPHLKLTRIKPNLEI